MGAREVDVAVALFSPVLWALAVAYAAAGIGLVWLAIVLAPWGLLILIVAFGAFGGATITGAVAFGISRLEEDPA